MSSCELTILMPCLNEAETLATCIQKAHQFLKSENIHGEILIADNGSQDGSLQIATALNARVISVATRGYGAALKAGILAANGRYIIMGDADDSYNFLDLSSFLKKLRDGYELVMGNRFQGGIVPHAMPFLNRYLGNPMLSLIGRLFFKSGVKDFHCGLRGFSREACLRLGLQGNGMEFASEMVVKASLQKLRVTEVPTQLFPDGRSRRPHLRPWRDGWRHLRLLLMLSPAWLFLYPGLMLLTIGCVSMGVLSMGPYVFNGVSLDIHTLLFSGLFIVIGVQAIWIYVYAQLINDVYLQTHTHAFLKQFMQVFTLERGLLLGLTFILLGVAGACYGFWSWQHQAFGPLIPTQMMRLLIPAVTFILLGGQFLFASFFLSILHLHLPKPIKDNHA